MTLLIQYKYNIWTQSLSLFIWVFNFSQVILLTILMLSRFSHVRLCATLWTAAHQAPLSTGFSRQEYWSGLPFPSLAHPSRLLQSPSLSSLSHTANSHWLFIPLSLLNTSHERSLSLPPTVLSALTE